MRIQSPHEDANRNLQANQAELVAGYNVEYASMGFALFFIGGEHAARPLKHPHVTLDSEATESQHATNACQRGTALAAEIDDINLPSL